MTSGLIGARVTLRAATEDDLDRLFEIASDLSSWEERNATPPRPLSRAAYAERFAAALTGPDVWFVIQRDSDVVGRCDLFGLDGFHRSAEVGIALHPSARGQGLGTDALRVLARFGFERRNLHRLHLTTLADNAAALSCYRKVGFVEEGRRRESAWVRGAYVDEIVMGLLRAEWRG